MNSRTSMMKRGLAAMHQLGLHHLMRPLSEGLGLILTLHRVRPAEALEFELGDTPAFNPNGLLEVTPSFLDATLDALKAQGLALISLEEALEALDRPHHRAGRFAVVTFDDGYIDNRDHALPVLEAHAAPAMIYVPSAFPKGAGVLWWVALEEIIRDADALVRPDRPTHDAVPTATADEKLAFYKDFYWALRAMSVAEQAAAMAELAASVGYDLTAPCRRLILDRSALKSFSEHPLITLGGHTVSHPAVAKLARAEALGEMVKGADWLQALTGERPKHFSFPYGDSGSAGPRDFQLAREAGFESAVTTRKGMLFAEHREHRFSLPRVSLNGDYQEARFVELFASGAPFMLANRFRKVA